MSPANHYNYSNVGCTGLMNPKTQMSFIMLVLNEMPLAIRWLMCKPYFPYIMVRYVVHVAACQHRFYSASLRLRCKYYTPAWDQFLKQNFKFQLKSVSVMIEWNNLITEKLHWRYTTDTMRRVTVVVAFRGYHWHRIIFCSPKDITQNRWGISWYPWGTLTHRGPVTHICVS